MKKCREIGWAIKLTTAEKYLAGPGGGWWVADIGQAIMFLRENDAKRMVEMLDKVAVERWGDTSHVVVERVVPL